MLIITEYKCRAGGTQDDEGYRSSEVKQMEEMIAAYYENNAGKLRRMVERILLKFGKLSEWDLDEFYSLANEVFADVIERYDGDRSFDAFLYSCLFNRIKTELTRMNREKRRADRLAVPIDTYIDEEGELTLGDIIAGDFLIEREVLEKSEEGYSRRTKLYLSRLSKLQKDVLCLYADGYSPDEVREKLQISKRQYTDCQAAIHSYRNTFVLL